MEAPFEGVVTGDGIVDLGRLFEPEVMLVTAPFEAPPAAHGHAAALALGQPGTRLAEVRTPDGRPDAADLGGLSEPELAGAAAWIEYLRQVTEAFALLVGAERVGVRQVVADGPHCPRFHVDRVAARAVLTVVGATTEWLDEPDVDRSRLGHAGGPDDASSGLIRPGATVGRARAGSLAVFKGTGWPGAEEAAIVHRSPPPDGARRLVLTLDWLD